MLKVNPSGKNSIRCQTYAKTEDSNSISVLGIPSTDSRHSGKCNICAFHEEIHAFEDWSFVRLSSLVLASEWTTNRNKLHKSKQVCNLIDRFRSIYDVRRLYPLILPFTCKTGQSVAQNRQKIFLFGFY